ncbi:MAG: hypothetical protein HGJ93_07085 [Desulfosarcina sp.]|nr:hypothetical protein [Desulfosarcina sp.]MBC2765710.1 hypothetical protein [Desulfosarcina sp.]
MTLFDDETTRRANRKQQFDDNFTRAIQKAFMEDLKGFLKRKSRRLLPFEEVKEKLGIWFARDLGIQSIPIDSIVGSEGRYRAFTRSFMPLQEDLRDRWKKIDQIRESRQDLPPVELYKVSNAYFVRDGHHRISVARVKGNKYIEARVYEYQCDVPLDKETDLEKLAIQENYYRFLKETGLNRSRPDHNLQMTRLEGYSILMEHIENHKNYLEKKDMTIQDAAASWFDSVYSPLAEVIRSNRIMKQFPHRTETDFYVWVVKYGRKLRQKLIKDAPAYNHPDNDNPADVVEAYAKKYGSIFRKIIGAFRRFFGLVKY